MIAKITWFSHLCRQAGTQVSRLWSHKKLTMLVSATFVFFPHSAIATTETILHTFTTSQPTHGLTAFSGVVIDKAGNLYGTTFDGGTFRKGTVFRLKLTKTGKWAYKLIHSFANDGQDGPGPATNLIFDNNGNLYGS